MNNEEHDDLWDLLGKARPVTPSPFFARNVLRAVRQAVPESGGFRQWFARRWALVAAGACAIALVAVSLNPPVEKPDPVTVLAQQLSGSPDYAVITNLDELLDTEASAVWLENSP